MSDTFEYDIAFSFLSQDETLAEQINDELQDRLRTFLYSEHQKQLAGTDGEETFKKVFSKEARTVAVLFRPQWGSTPWTRIEETAIRDRAHDEGYDFCTFIALNDPIERPTWLPKNRLLFGLQRFQIKGAAAVLEARVQEHGGTVSQETVGQTGQRLKRAQEFSTEAEHFRSSEVGVNAAEAAVGTLLTDVARHVAELSATGVSLAIRKFQMGYHSVNSPHAVLVYWWERRYSNSLDGAGLHISFYDHFPKLPGIIVFDEPRTLEKLKLEFKLVGPKRAAWVCDQVEVAPEQLAEYLLKRLMHWEESELTRKRK